MASTNLQILIQAAVQGLNQVTQLGQQLAATGQSAVTAGGQAQGAGAGFSQAGKGAQQASGQLADFVTQGKQAAESFNTLVGYVKAAAAAFVAFAAVSSLKGAADLAARNETLAVTLGIVGQNAGYSKDELTKYEQELKALGISTGAARDSMTQMIQAGLDLGPATEGAASQVAQLARAAQDLAVVTGENSSDTLQRMVTNIQQLDTVGLKFMGVIVDMDTATQKYAESIGKTAGELNNHQKQQAMMNAVLKEAAKMQGAYEASLDTVGKKLSSMKRYQEEAAASIGETLLPAYGVLVDAATEFLKQVQSVAQAIADNGKVAEVLRDTLKSVLDFAGAISKSLVGAVQSIAPAVEQAGSKIKAAFDGIDGSGLIETFQSIVEWATRMGTMIVEAVGNAAPSIRLLYDAFMMVFDSVKDAIVEMTGFGESTMDSATAGELLSTVLQALGLLVAGFADGLSIVKAVAEIMFAGLMVGFGAISNVIGDLVGLVDKDLGEAFKQTGDAAIDMGMKSAEAARKTFKQFADGETYVQKYADKLKELPAAHEADAEAAKKSSAAKSEAYKSAEEMVRKYAEAVRKGELSGAAANAEYQKIVKSLNEMKDSGMLTQKQIELLGTKLSGVKESADKTGDAFKALGVSAGEFTSKASDAGNKAVSAFNDIAKSGKYAADQLYNAFNKAIDMETSIAGLQKFKKAADDAFGAGSARAKEYQAEVKAVQEAFKSGEINVQQYGTKLNELSVKYKDVTASADTYRSALQLIGAKFDEVFDKQLKAAKTKEDFRQLTEQVQDMGAKGVISGQQVTNALTAIREKASGAREEMQRLAQQTTDLAESGTRLAQADLAVSQAHLGVLRAKNDLIQAENRHKQEGTDLSKAELEVARANYAVAQAQEELARRQKAMEQAANDVLIAQQQLLNAEKEKERNIGDANAQAKVDAAQRELEQKNLGLEAARQSVAEGERNVAVTQQAATEAEAFAQGLRNAKDAAASTGDDIRKVRDWVRDANGEIMKVSAVTFDGLVKQFQDIGLSLSEASARATDLMGGMQMIVAFGAAGVNKFQQIQDELRKTKEHLEAQAEAAQKIEADYAAVKERAEDIARAGGTADSATRRWGESADAVSEAYRRIRKDATDAARAAEDATDNFVKSTLSIRQELLNAQGREEEATRLQYAQRKRDLALEYQLLEVKIKAAMVQAKAAGVDTKGLEASLSDAKDAFGQAQKDLAELEKMQLESIRKKKAEDAKAAEEAKQKALADEKEKAATRAKEDAQMAADAASQAPRAAGSGTAVQSIASGTGSGGGSGVVTGSGRTINVQFNLGGSTVTAAINESDESKFLEMLKKAKGVS